MNSIFITGVTGTLSAILIEHIERVYPNCRIRGVARDCSKLAGNNSRVECIDLDLSLSSNITALSDFLSGSDLIIHTAALKSVVDCTKTPDVAVDTNIIATLNLIEAAKKAGVKRFVNISSDMAVEPIGVYGATKLIQAAIVVAKSVEGEIEGCNIRLGNIFSKNSGSIIHFFNNYYKTHGNLRLTHPEMNRFAGLDYQIADLIFSAANNFIGGETFVPKLKSYDIMTIAEAIAPGSEKEVVGMREGEKLYEIMVSKNESERCYQNNQYFVIIPQSVDIDRYVAFHAAKRCKDGFSLTSQNNPDRFTIDQIIELAREIL